LQVKAMMELLEVCLRTTYFQVVDKFFQQKDDMAMGSSLSPIISNIFMSILRNWLLTQHNENYHGGSSTLMTHLWSGLMVQSSYRISSAISIV
jgi:retron-type reverse transcriptase